MRENGDITNAVKTHADTVLRICSLYFHGRPERDDAFQETFLKYAQIDKAFENNEHVKAWLINVAANTCKDMLKRADVRVVLTDSFEDDARPGWVGADAAGNMADDGGHVAGFATAAEGDSSKIDALNEALQQLDDKYRIALYLKYYEGYAAAEIADLLNIPENTVYTNLARGRKQLKEVLTHGKR